MPSGHGDWTVSDGGCGGGPAIGAVTALVVAVFALAALVAAVVAFVLAHAVVLAWGFGGVGFVVAAGDWLAWRYLTVCYWNPAAAVQARRQAVVSARTAQVTQVVVHRHVIEYAEAPPAIENPHPLVTAAVLAAARETEEIPR
jgi:hypothetical protein